MAILYFENRTRDSADAFLADGLTEELITRLSQVERLDVKSRFESLRARDARARDPAAIGRMLRSTYLVTGTLQQSGQRVRLNVALVRSANGSQVWGNVYDRTGTDLLTIQSDIAQEVAAGITGELLPAERRSLSRRGTRDPLAFDLYLRGVGVSNTLSETGVRAGLEYFDRAIARDSAFADAWARKAYVWVMIADGFADGRTGYGAARVAASRALAVDSSQALAWAVLGHATLALDANWAQAIREADRALALDHRSSMAFAIRGYTHLAEGLREQGLADLRRGYEADTAFVPATVMYLMVLARIAPVDSLERALRRARTSLAPEVLTPFEGILLLRRGDPAGAARQLNWSYYGGMFAQEYFAALAALGRRDAIQAAMDSMLAIRSTGYFNAFPVAAGHAALGDADRAFEWLGRAWDERTSWVQGVAWDEGFATLRGDPRFTELRRRIGQQPR